MNYTALDRELDMLADDLAECRITHAEYQREYRNLMQDAAQAQRDEELCIKHGTHLIDEAYYLESQ